MTRRVGTAVVASAAFMLLLLLSLLPLAMPAVGVALRMIMVNDCLDWRVLTTIVLKFQINNYF